MTIQNYLREELKKIIPETTSDGALKQD
jgi:hypothetical protein